MLASCVLAGMDDPSGSRDAPASAACGRAAALLPSVAKNADPSSVIAKYMDGIAKRMNKIEETRLSID